MATKVFRDDWPPRRCSGPCDQGRRECPCPDACERPPMTRRDFWTVAALFVLAWSVVCAAIVVVAS